MNLFLMTAAALCFFGAIFHEKVGTPRIAVPIMASELDVRVKTIAKIVWHSVTFSLGFSSLALIYFALGNSNIAACLLIAAYTQSFAFIFWYCCRKYLAKANFFPHPWVFSAITISILIGLSV